MATNLNETDSKAALNETNTTTKTPSKTRRRKTTQGTNKENGTNMTTTSSRTRSKITTKTEQIKNFVLDTNIPLIDPYCIRGFGKNNIIIPIIVIQELDKFKNGNESINFLARTFLKELDTLIKEAKTRKYNTKNGIPIGKGFGKLFFHLGSPYSEKMAESFYEDTPDNRILAICDNLKKNERNVVLITNDINLRIKSEAFDITSEEYKNELVQDMSRIYQSIISIELDDKEMADITPHLRDEILPDIAKTKDVMVGQNIVLCYQGEEKLLVRKRKEGLRNVTQALYNCPRKTIMPRNLEQKFGFDCVFDPKQQVVALTGKAGTGKTFLSLVAAMIAKEYGENYEEILVARPVIEMNDKTMGFLPGSDKDKTDPYMDPIYDNLAEIMKDYYGKKDKETIASKRKEKKQENGNGKVPSAREVTKNWALGQGIEVLVLNFIRGRSLSHRIIIIDEAQNLSHFEIKTILTRAGEGTKIIFIGDLSQIDVKYLNEQSSGLARLVDIWNGEPEFSHVHLQIGERSGLAEKAANIM